MASDESEALGNGGPGDAGPEGIQLSNGLSPRVAVGSYSWEEFKEEFFYEDGTPPTNWRGKPRPFPAEEFLGFDPDETDARVETAAETARALGNYFESFLDYEETPVALGSYYWEHFRYEYYYDPDREKPHEKPRDEEGNVIEFEKADWLGFEEADLPDLLTEGAAKARKLLEVEDERTLDVPPELDEDAFFSTVEGYTTVVNRYDLEKAVALPKKRHFREVDRYWVNKPYSCVIIFHSEKENETKYYLVEPYRTRIDEDLREFLTGKLRTSIKYASDDVLVEADEEAREDVIEREALRLLSRYVLYMLDDDQIADLLKGALSGYDSARETWTRYSTEIGTRTDETLRTLSEQAEPYLEPLREKRAGVFDSASKSKSNADLGPDSDVESASESSVTNPDEPNADDGSSDSRRVVGALR
jgi:hypothetical protein